MVELTGASVSQIHEIIHSSQFPYPIGRFENAEQWDEEEVTEWFEDNPVRTIADRGGGSRLSTHPQLDNDMARAFITGQFGERH